MKSKKVGYIKTYSIWWLLIIGLVGLLPICNQINLLEQEINPDGQFIKFEHKQALKRNFKPQKAILARVTCYLPTGNPMANGKWPKAGYVATSDRSIPFGTKILIGGQEYEVGDRTALWVHKLGNTVDIFKENCTKEFGAKVKQVFILN